VSRFDRPSLFGVALVGMLVVAACGGGSSASSSGKPTGPINVGAVFALTGNAAPFGQAREEGVAVAIDDINAAGGVLGQKLNLIPVNTSSDPVDAVPAVRQMLAADNISVAQGLTAADWPNALPLFEQAKMVIFDHVPDPSIDTKATTYEWRTVPSDGLEGTAMVMAANHLGYHNVALAFQASDEAQSLLPAIQRAASKLGVNIVANPQLPVGAPSYAAEVRQIVNAHPDAILLQLQPQQSGNFFHSLEELGGSQIPVVGSDSTTTSEWIQSVGADIVARQVVSVVPASSPSGPGANEFYPIFQQKFGHAPRTNSANGYDGMTVAALAMEAAGSIDPKVYVNYIMKVTTPGSGITDVYSYAQGLQLLKQGKAIKYIGIGSDMTYNKYHAITGPFEIDKVPAGGTVQTQYTMSAADVAQVIA